MTTNTIIIILTAGLILIALMAVFLFIKYRKLRRMSFSESEMRLKRDLRKALNNLDRYKTLYENVKNTSEYKRKQTSEHRQTAAYKYIMNEAESVMMERKQLEEQKNDIEYRNRRLWEMSLSIQKEKEHIDLLKYDIEQKHRAVTDSIHYARYIQLAVLPPLDALQESFADYFIFWRPLEIVSGDFYWMKRFDNKIVFTVADCTGHGVPGAFMSLLGITFLNEICANINDKTLPSDILESLRSNIITATSHASEDGNNKSVNDGMDIALCIYNMTNKTLSFCGANNPMYRVRDGVLTQYKPTRNPIGNYPVIKQFETQIVDIQSGDWIYMFSDGMEDQFSSKSNRKLTAGKFRQLIAGLSQDNANGDNQSKKLSEFLVAWRGDSPQLDDIMVAGYQIP